MSQVQPLITRSWWLRQGYETCHQLHRSPGQPGYSGCYQIKTQNPRGELVDPWGLRSNAVWDAEQGKGLELGVLVLSPRGWPWIGGFPPWASVFLSIK